MYRIRRTQSFAACPEAPFFLLPPRNASVHKGENATFYVKVKGHPEPELCWYREEEAVPQAGRFHLERVGQGAYIFTITEVTAADAGRYRCEVKNCAGSQQNTVRLDLKDQASTTRMFQSKLRRIQSWGESHPRFVTKPSGQAVSEGECAVFRARVTGRPPPQVTWLKDSTLLGTSPRVRLFHSAGFFVLEVLEVQREDAGLYTCELSSPTGRASTTAQLRVLDPSTSSTNPNSVRKQIVLKSPTHPARDQRDRNSLDDNNGTISTNTQHKAKEDNAQPEPPVFTQPLADCTVDEGSDIALQGIITGTQPIHISWLHNGETVQFGKPFFQGNEARLVVKECLPEDAGAYTCVAENRAGKTSSSAAVCVRDFESICMDRSMKIKCAAVNGRSKDSSPVSAALPQASGRSRGDRSHKHSKDFENVGMDRSRKIQASAVDCITEQRGRSKASAAPPQALENSRVRSGEPGLCLRTGSVTPKRKPTSSSDSPLRLLDLQTQVEVRVGEQAELSCRFDARLPVAACWIQQKKKISDGPRTRVETSERRSRLLIRDVRPDDSGRYTLLVRDRSGHAQHHITLTVIDRPQPPAGQPYISQVSSGSLTLSWSGPCYDGGSAVTRYRVEVRKEGPDGKGDWTELTASCSSTSYHVRTGLEPHAEYRFRVRASNKVGESEPSQESDTIRMDNVEGIEAQYSWISINTTQKVTDLYDPHLERLGVGKFGQVFKLLHKETGKVSAGKFYKARTSKEKASARREIELMNSLHHPKLVQCQAAFENRSDIVMVMEYIAGGELFERIVDDNFEHTEPTSACYMRQILEGVQYMHHRNIVHLDLKPENIVCVNRTGTLIKIIDFGLASKLDPKTPLKVMHGTPEFVAPEVIAFEPVGLVTDMWSIGVICYILLSGESPFQGSTDSETLALVTEAQWEFEEESFEAITDQAKDFISHMLKKNMKHRLTCDQALAHPWMETVKTMDPRATKSLSKMKMKKFLARQKWQKTGKAVLALKRMSLLSNKQEGATSHCPPVEKDELQLSLEEERALHSLEQQLRSEPRFLTRMQDLSKPEGSSVCLQCHIQGYPDPEVLWFRGEEPLRESSTIKMEYEEDGSCSLLLSNTSPEDTGLYSCKATNSQGEAVCSARLTISPLKSTKNRYSPNEPQRSTRP
ncbi:LOW QUALITY PROTEIN: myosin light chain kinase, smooth muscle [Polyodon spathula]|uniref:LOW QUALITY PROTEIN: myosin light chain kinase, smooth muscle n=1 Tax=Polyodon spathula TaxID=7913 RepID=UPI001B7DE613|nr:LOW QUALITY PROTEIN: myosin light chain kinase, smooth muscle [Polyodon spathula]